MEKVICCRPPNCGRKHPQRRNQKKNKAKSELGISSPIELTLPSVSDSLGATAVHLYPFQPYPVSKRVATHTLLVLRSPIASSSRGLPGGSAQQPMGLHRVDCSRGLKARFMLIWWQRGVTGRFNPQRRYPWSGSGPTPRPWTETRKLWNHRSQHNRANDVGWSILLAQELILSISWSFRLFFFCSSFFDVFGS